MSAPRIIDPALKTDKEWWNQNVEEPYPPIWFVNKALGTNAPESSSLDGLIDDANYRGDWMTADSLSRSRLKEHFSDSEISEAQKKWVVRNPMHNLTWYAIGVCDRLFQFNSSNPNPAEPTSPFSVNGHNEITITMSDATGNEDLGFYEAIFVYGFWKLGLRKDKAIEELIGKVQKAKILRGHSFRGDKFEYYWGWKPGGNFGLAFRNRQEREIGEDRITWAGLYQIIKDHAKMTKL